MGFVTMEEGVGMPPQALFDAMDAHIGERAARRCSSTVAVCTARRTT
jgi:hypothetical protein